MTGGWVIRFVPSPLALRARGPAKAVVVSLHPRVETARTEARLYEGWVGGVKVYDPANHFTVGEVLRT